MTQTTHSATYPVDPTLYIAIELSSRTWTLASSAGGRTIRTKTIPARSFEALREEVERARRRFHLPSEIRVLICEEAGRDGFSIHRILEQEGYESLVVDPASLKVSQKKRRAKTDRLDARALVRALVSYDRGDEDTWSVVRVPAVEAEDERRPSRELGVLKKERARETLRIKSDLALVGVRIERVGELEEELESLRTLDGSKLPVNLKAKLRRQLERWRLLNQQIRELKKEQKELLKNSTTKQALIAKKLQRLLGIGPRIAWTMSTELFAWREFRSRRELAGFLGLCGTPFNTGISDREQGISKAGPPRLRALLVQAAWLWVTRWQTDSDLARWYRRKWAADPRRKKAGIVAVARRLAIALWRFVELDIVPKGAVLRAA